MPDFRIYPSLLDKFQQLVDYEIEAEQSWNIVSEYAKAQGRHPDKEVGDYILSPDEMYRKIEAELIDTINRVPHRPSEAADKGTAFNEIVDCLIEKRKSSRDDIVIYSTSDKSAIVAEINGFSFAFDTAFCRNAARYFSGAIPQYLAKAQLPTKYGDVELYGYVDELLPTRVCDIKTTSAYSFGKFERKWQRHLYPYCLIVNGDATQIDEFEYTVFKWNNTPILTADLYKEVYTYNHKKSTEALRDVCEYFIYWLLKRKNFISDRRIFGGENAPDYVGKPINPNLL